MDTILTGDIWKQVRSQAAAAKRRIVAVAYVTTDGGIKFQKNDVLICDASDEAIKSGKTSARLLQSLHRKGVELSSIPSLHAKTAVFGRYALIGSCNLSTSSAEDLTELALLTDRTQVVAQTTAFIHTLRESADEVGDSFLRRIRKIKVRQSSQGSATAARPPLDFGNKVWLVSLRELSVGEYAEEYQYVEKAEKEISSLAIDDDDSITPVRSTGKSRFRVAARPGDMIVQIWTSLSGKRIAVIPPCPIVYRQDVDHWTRFYVAESDDRGSLSWARFAKAAKQYGIKRISKNSVRELHSRESLAIESLWP